MSEGALVEKSSSLNSRICRLDSSLSAHVSSHARAHRFFDRLMSCLPCCCCCCCFTWCLTCSVAMLRLLLLHAMMRLHCMIVPCVLVIQAVLVVSCLCRDPPVTAWIIHGWAGNSCRKVRQSSTIGSRSVVQTVDMSPAPAAGTYRRSAGTVHSDRSLGNVWHEALGYGGGPGSGPSGWSGLVWASLRPAWGFLARWWCHQGGINLHRNPWVGRGYMVLGSREFGC